MTNAREDFSLDAELDETTSWDEDDSRSTTTPPTWESGTTTATTPSSPPASRTSPSGMPCAGWPACPPSSRTSPRSSTASSGSSGSSWSASGPRERWRTPRTPWPSSPRWPRRPAQRSWTRSTSAAKARPGDLHRPRQGRGAREIVPHNPRRHHHLRRRTRPRPATQPGGPAQGKAVDRTALILDIFAQHASAGRARRRSSWPSCTYMKQRLRRWGGNLSRQAGGRVAGGAGIGSRGPGETKIENDRRRINTKIAKLRRDLREMKGTRDTKRQERRRHHVPSVRSPATPTPASPRCSTGSPAPACWSRTRCSPPWTRPPVGRPPPTAGSTR